jgi:hypothetical protein
MFPIYYNPYFLTIVKKYWNTFNSKISSQKDRIFLYKYSSYIEHISISNKLPDNEQYWSNALCIELDKKYWKFFKNPFIINDNFLTPKAGCGYFLMDPNYKYSNKKINKSNNNNFIIYISKKLYDELQHLVGLNWKIPSFIKIHKELLHNYDIIIVDDKNKIIAPYLSCNISLIFDI